jgi:hypothetical protein
VFSDCKTPTLVSCLSPCISSSERVCACIFRGNTPIEWWIFENVASQTRACFHFAHIVRKQWSFHRCWSYCKLDSTSNLKGSSTQLIILFSIIGLFSNLRKCHCSPPFCGHTPVQDVGIQNDSQKLTQDSCFTQRLKPYRYWQPSTTCALQDICCPGL